jgi:rhamnosyl/mannosyltransferase
MKVLQLAKNNPSSFYGGIETVVQSFNHSHKLNQDSIVSIVKGGVDTSDYKVIGKRFFFLKRAYWIYKNINSFDLVYIHLPNIFVLLPALLFCKDKKKLICVYHSDILKFSIIGKIYQLITHLLLEFISTIICSSSELIKSSRTLSFYNDKCSVLHYSIPPNDFERVQSDEEGYLLLIAREGHYKGLDFAISTLKDHCDKVKIIGVEGKSSSNIEFLGKVSDEEKWKLIDNCLFLLMTSTSNAESYGMVIVEAFSRSKSVIAPDVGTGVNFLVKGGVRGILFPLLDKKLLLESVSRLKDDNDLRGALEKNIGEFYSRELSFEIFHKNLISLLRKNVSI